MAAQQIVVIVVDDNAGFLKGVARLLAHNGIESRTFASAEALLDSGSAQTATCLLLDIHLGGISGIELQRRLAASGWKCPVIFMTANGLPALPVLRSTTGSTPLEGEVCAEADTGATDLDKI